MTDIENGAYVEDVEGVDFTDIGIPPDTRYQIMIVEDGDSEAHYAYEDDGNGRRASLPDWVERRGVDPHLRLWVDMKVEDQLVSLKVVMDEQTNPSGQ
jgi:hypothetical protein